MLAGYEMRRWQASQAATEFSDYLHERWKGQAFVPEGTQIVQFELSQGIYGAVNCNHERSGCPNPGENNG
jgi:hypothetical protein